MQIPEEYNKDNLFLIMNNNNNNRIFLFRVYILGISFFLLLGFDLSLVLQQGHTTSLEKKNKEQSEHHF